MFFLILYWEVHKTYGTNDVLNNKRYISNFMLQTFSHKIYLKNVSFAVVINFNTPSPIKMFMGMK
jgi:hypothetical protein